MGDVKREGDKVYIEGVRKVSWDTGEMCEFASSFVSALNSLGEATAYVDVLGASGVAFRFTISPGEWDFGNYSIRKVAADPYEAVCRAFAAAGYACTICEPGCLEEDAAKIMDSIDRGVPVLAFHVVGPADCCVITGYDQRGEVLLGWSTFQDIPVDHNIPHDPTGYFRKPGWHENLPGYVLIGEKIGRPPLRDSYLEALKWAVYLLRTPRMGLRTTGLAGLRAWAEEMTTEKFYPAEDAEVMGIRYFSSSINMTMLRDHCSAEAFLLQAAADVPGFQPELARAAGCYSEVKRLRAGMDDLIGDNFTEQAIEAIKHAEVRRAYADAILHIRDVEEEAAGHIQQLLERCGEY